MPGCFHDGLFAQHIWKTFSASLLNKICHKKLCISANHFLFLKLAAVWEYLFSSCKFCMEKPFFIYIKLCFDRSNHFLNANPTRSLIAVWTFPIATICLDRINEFVICNMDLFDMLPCNLIKIIRLSISTVKPTKLGLVLNNPFPEGQLKKKSCNCNHHSR